ncbi:MAG: HPP family protein [Lentisphaerae bacterium]|nr:HPP family protein [Lentisphaerota bacterium]
MRPFDRVLDRRVRPFWPSYVLQSVLAAASIFVVLVALHRQNLVVAASLAATAFTVFTMPGSMTASARNVIGGHVVGLAFGSVFALASPQSPFLHDAMYALAVGCAMFVMAATNTEHPPAAGTALGVAMAGLAWRLLLGVLLGAVLLVLIHRLLRPVLRDLVAAPELAGQEKDNPDGAAS